MPTYRAYVQGPDGHFIDRRDIAAPDDDEAITHARRLADRRPIEVCCGVEWSRKLIPRRACQATSSGFSGGAAANGDPEGRDPSGPTEKYTPGALVKCDDPANFTGDTGQFGKRGFRSCEFSLRLALSRFL
jgi:hypothetical protein